MQIDINDFNEIKKYVAPLLERESVSHLLDYIESEFEFLLKDLPEDFHCTFKERFSTIESFLKDITEPLTIEIKNEFTSQLSTAFIMYGMYLKNSKLK